MEFSNYDYNLLIKLRKKSILPYYGFSINAVTLLFVKYLRCYDDSDLTKTYNDKILNDNFDLGIKPFLDKVERENKTNGILSIGLIELIVFVNSSIDIKNYLKSDLKAYTKTEKIELIKNLLAYSSNDKTKLTSFKTNETLSKLVSRILNVNENQTFLNTFAGFYSLALNVCAKKYFGYEKNLDALTFAYTVLLYIEGKNFKDKYDIIYDDIYEIELNNNIIKVDRVFSDGPIIECMKNIKITLDFLKDDGIGIVVVPARFLFEKRTETINYKKNLMDAKFISAVIELPPLLYETLVNPYLLVLSKKVNNSITFISANTVDFYYKDGSNYFLTDNGIDKIINALKYYNVKDNELKNKDYSTFSKCISYEEILKDDTLSLYPMKYIDNIKTNELRDKMTILKDLLDEKANFENQTNTFINEVLAILK